MSIAPWSFSKIKAFEQCPKKFYHLKIAKDYSEPETEAMYYAAARPPPSHRPSGRAAARLASGGAPSAAPTDKGAAGRSRGQRVWRFAALVADHSWVQHTG